MVIGPGRRLVPAVRFRLSVYHTTRLSTVFGLVWQRRYQSFFPNHWKMAVSVIRFLPHHVMRRLTFQCVAQQKAIQCIFPMFFPWCGHPGTASLARQSAAKSGRFSPDGKTGHGTSGAADERHPGPPQAASHAAPLLASRLSPPARAPLRITPFSAPRRRRSRRPHLLWMTRRVCG